MSSLLLIGGALVVLGSSLATYTALAAGGGSLGRGFHAYEMRLERRTSFLLLACGGETIARAQLVGVCVCGAFFSVTRVAAFAVAAVLAALVPPIFLWKRHAIRVGKLERQLDTWLLMLANALKATSSVAEATASTVALVPRPFSEEVDLLVKEMRLGVPLDRALNAMAGRIQSSVVSGALTLIVVASRTGGDLSGTLERASAALREVARLEGVLRTKTAEGRGQVVILALVPFVLCIVIAWLDQSWFDPMLHHPYGRAILVACALAWTAAVSWAHHIVGSEL